MVMRRKQFIIFLVSACLVFCGIVFLAGRHEEKVAVDGNLSANDLAEIKSIVQVEKRRSVFPGFSWRNILHLPSATIKELRYKFIEIARDKTNSVIVTTGLPQPKSGDSWTGYEWYELEKDSNGWHLLPPDPYPDHKRTEMPNPVSLPPKH
jgi:hypothetical protein